jgi:hypothetical protein
MRLTEEDKRFIEGAFSVMSVGEIARELNCSIPTVRYTAKQLGLSKPKGTAKTRLLALLHEQMEWSGRVKMTNTQMCKRLRISYGTFCDVWCELLKEGTVEFRDGIIRVVRDASGNPIDGVPR